MKLIIFLFFCLFLNVCSFNSKTSIETKKYGEQVYYASGSELEFPDFSIKFVGKQKLESGKDTVPYIRMTVYKFEVVNGNAKQNIDWARGKDNADGTARVIDNPPATLFEVNGVKFMLEIEKSDILKSLDDGNLVIWTTADYEDELMKHNK